MDLKIKKSFIASLNLSFVKTPYFIKGLISSQNPSYLFRSFLKISCKLSDIFFTIYWEIFWTCLSCCKKLLETFNGISGISIPPRNNSINSGISCFKSSATKTLLQNNFTLPWLISKLFLNFGKYRIPFKL